MTDNDEIQPPEYEAQGQQPDDEPKVLAGDRERKRPKSASGNRSDRRFTIITASISASAALLGALVGGISTYMVAQRNNIADADTAQIASRKSAYADYLSAETDLEGAEYKLADTLRDQPNNLDAVLSAVNQFNDRKHKEWRVGDIVSLVDSDPVKNARIEIAKEQHKIQHLEETLVDQASDHKVPDRSELNEMYTRLDGMSHLQDLFIDSARRDMTPPTRGLFS